MPPKQKTPAPIDRPLSRAYLREFTGWSSAYPPGISDPTSLRIMENVMIQRDGSVRVRPGLRYLSILDTGGTPIDQDVVGTHEPFFLGNGSKAYLFAVREDDGAVGFRVLANTGLGLVVQPLTAAGVDFSIPQGEAVLRFPASTTYVKYLQIDNKIFALSNSGESMRLFTVGTGKTAKKLNAIERPAWNPGDKLTVVHPTQAWVNSGVPTGTRTNLLWNPSVELSTENWVTASPSVTSFSRSTAQARVGGVASLRVESKPVKTNYMPYPLAEPVASLGGWVAGSGTNPDGVLSVTGGKLHVAIQAGDPVQRYYVNAPVCTNVPREQSPGVNFQYWATFDWATTGSPVETGVLYRWFASNGAMISEAHATVSDAGGRRSAFLGACPSGGVSLQIYPYIVPQTETIGIGAGLAKAATYTIDDVVVSDDGHQNPFFDGDSGANYFWTGAADASSSVYHPPQSVNIQSVVPCSAGLTYAGSAYVRAGSVPANFRMQLGFLDSGGATLSAPLGGPVADVNSGWTRFELVAAAPAGAVWCGVVLQSDPIGRGEYHYLDDAMLEQAAAVGAYFDGAGADTSTVQYAWTGDPHHSPSTETLYSAPTAVPGPATPTANTLIGTGANTYNFGFFYTFANEVGESAASQVTVVKAQRGWSQWKWETPNAAAEPSGTATTDPGLCADQLVAYMPSAVLADALDQGAILWNLYMMTWSDQDPVPVGAVRIASRAISPGAAHGSFGWLRMTPQQADANSETSALPSEVSRFNYSTPSSGGQGIVAADRMVLVYDPAAPAVIRWSSNQQGNYTDFSASRGGGFKTLTSGNLFVPAVVKLWQNPQSVDTLTILCLGVDGHSTGYYMQPAQVAQQSEAVNIMGFEETTATPGTTSPYGCEVLNNALYHPLDEQLMKSTATNYNINHSSMTDQIQNLWRALADKHQIVSSHLDNRIYYLVNNPLGEDLEPGCWGNEVWVLDAAQKQGTWSRWLVQGQSLRKFEQGGQVVMSLVRPDGIHYFDDAYNADDYVAGGVVESRSIPWRLETNTQGANRAHDAWAHLQQANVIVGNFLGTMQYGVRGLDINGRIVEKTKVLRDPNAPSADGTTFDLEDYLLVQRDMKEWFFFAGSVEDDLGETLPSMGQINLVQYRYTPSTVNTGYEFGSVETFEYGRAGNAVGARTSDNGVPMPYIDTGRP